MENRQKALKRRTNDVKKIKNIVAWTMAAILLLTQLVITPIFAGGGYDFVPNLVQGVNADGTVTAGTILTVDIDDLEKSASGFRDAYLIDETVEVYWSCDGVEMKPTYTAATGLFTFTVREQDIGKSYMFVALGTAKGTNLNNNTKSYPVVKAKSPGGETTTTKKEEITTTKANTETTTKKEETTTKNENTEETTKKSDTKQGQGSIDITLDKKGIATVTGKSTGSASFTGLFVDDYTRVSDLSGKSFKVTFDTKKYDIGYHELSAKLDDGSEIYYPKVFPTLIYDTPSLKASCFKTDSKKANFSTPNHDGHKYDYYLQFKKDNEKWEKFLKKIT